MNNETKLTKLCPSYNETKPTDIYKTVRCPTCVRSGKLSNCRICSHPILKISHKDPTIHNDCKRKRKSISAWNEYVRKNYSELNGSMKERMNQISKKWEEENYARNKDVSTVESLPLMVPEPVPNNNIS